MCPKEGEKSGRGETVERKLVRELAVESCEGKYAGDVSVVLDAG